MASSYLQSVFNNWEETVVNTYKAIKESKLDFDAVVCRGVSGMLVGPAVASRLDKPFVFIRKENDGSHARNRVEYSDFLYALLSGRGSENNRPQFNYIVVDDLISTGATIDAIVKEINLTFKNFSIPKIKGIFCYAPPDHHLVRDNQTTIQYKTGLDIPVFHSQSTEMEKWRQRVLV